MKRRFKFILCFVALVLLAACATQYHAYYVIDREFTEAVKKYDSYYNAASETTKMKWDKEITPTIVKASDALDAYRLALDINDPDVGAKFKTFSGLKDEVFQLLQKYGIIKVVEE